MEPPIVTSRCGPFTPIPLRKVVPLSILDAGVATFAATSALWYFRVPFSSAQIDAQCLVGSLGKTLDNYPHWTGRLKYNPQHFGRLLVEFGGEVVDDPGVEIILATYDTLWHQVSNADLLTKRRFTRIEQLECPCSIQITTFADNTYSIGIKIVHPLADAKTMTGFMIDWSLIHRGRSASPRIFDPSLIDNAAVKSILGDLPMHRYDFWNSASGCPSGMEDETKIPQHIADDESIKVNLGAKVPWHEWDLNKECIHCYMCFDKTAIETINASIKIAGFHVSTLDGVLAYLWSAINRARAQVLHVEGEVYVDYSLNVTSRLTPAVPEDFVGSPLVIAKCAATVNSSLIELAKSIRKSLSQFQNGPLRNLLAELKEEISPSRKWDAFLGERHCMVTSWVRAGCYDVDFGGGGPARVVAVVPNMDGLIVIMEDGPVSKGKTWWESGIRMSVSLIKEVMMIVKEDPGLIQVGVKFVQDTNS